MIGDHAKVDEEGHIPVRSSIQELEVYLVLGTLSFPPTLAINGLVHLAFDATPLLVL